MYNLYNEIFPSLIRLNGICVCVCGWSVSQGSIEISRHSNNLIISYTQFLIILFSTYDKLTLIWVPFRCNVRGKPKFEFIEIILQPWSLFDLMITFRCYFFLNMTQNKGTIIIDKNMLNNLNSWCSHITIAGIYMFGQYVCMCVCVCSIEEPSECFSLQKSREYCIKYATTILNMKSHQMSCSQSQSSIMIRVLAPFLPIAINIYICERNICM